jgi:hypothetical protein
MNQTANPLRQFFRQPKLYVRLPSGGQFWPQGSLDMPPNNELPVLPMTALDEISYRTPDALFNGASVVNVVQSCMPNIKNAWQMPAVDLNTILVAIRIASYGNEAEINTHCPHCDADNEYLVNLRGILDQMESPDYAKSLARNDIELFFKPLSYEQQSQINIAQFEQQRIITQLPSSDLPEEEKNKMLNAALEAITKITIQAITYTISVIRTPQAIVTEPEFIREFLANCDHALYAEIRNHAINLRSSDELKPLKITCPECNKDFEQPFVLDTASFFGIAS